MQASKTEFFNRYNYLLKLALNKSNSFPDDLSKFLVQEFELDGCVFFKFTEEKKFISTGRYGNTRKVYTDTTPFECSDCRDMANSVSISSFDIHNACAIPVSEFVVYEGSLALSVNDGTRYLLKLARKSPFTKAERDIIEQMGEYIINLITVWGGKRSSNKNIGEIITDIAHELRTPTNSIMGFASLLNEDNLTSSQAEYVSTLKESAYNLLSLINDLIELSRIDSGLSKETLADVNVKNLIDDIIKLFSDKIDKSRIEFLTNFDPAVPESIKADGQKLKFILVNVISFALRLTERGRITLAVYPDQRNRISFKITDSGSGIPSGKLKNVFDPFVISELSSVKTGPATGLGLTLARRYAELLRGSIDVQSTLGKGTTYNILISTGASSPIEEQIISLPKPTAKNKVLVVEDDYATSKLLSNYLNKWGYDPSIVNSAEQALKAIEKESFLAILMDIVLPDGSGFDLLQQIRENKHSRNTPVIVCSVEAEQQKAFLMGAVEYFVKPIKYKYLVEVLTSYKLKKDSNILIVDDDVPTLNLMKQAVEESGYNAIAEAHSSKVMDLIATTHLDLAIIDLDMPELSGFDLIKLIKTNPRFSKLPIIIYTGKENYQDDLKRIDGLFEELLLKSSTNIEDLADTINQMINRYDEPSKPEEAAAIKEGVKILLVEDYKHSQIIVTRLLKKNNFDTIVVVENGAEALDQVKQQRFDLILMDMQMPVMNGFEATEKIRQLDEYKETPIIALTAFAMKGDREKCLEAGATDYIPKPIDSHEFIEKVKYYTESKVGV
jgi:CheY-like chemotaxis protein/signal transduction histidine kinase